VKITRLGEFLPAAPKPIFFTHATTKEKCNSIEKLGKILPIEEDVVPCSLDGGLRKPVWGDYKFLFPMAELTGKKVEPVFYLGTNDIIETVEGPGFLIMDMTCMFATEIRIYGELSISKSRLFRNVPTPPTALMAFIVPIFPELKAHGLGVIGLGPEIYSYTPMLLSTVDAYNRMLSEYFNISYEKVKEVASESSAWEDIWWR